MNKFLYFVFIITLFTSCKASNKEPIDNLIYIDFANTSLSEKIHEYITYMQNQFKSNDWVVTMRITDLTYGKIYNLSVAMHELGLEMGNYEPYNNDFKEVAPPLFYTIVNNKLIFIYSGLESYLISRSRYEHVLKIIKDTIPWTYPDLKDKDSEGYTLINPPPTGNLTTAIIYECQGNFEIHYNKYWEETVIDYNKFCKSELIEVK
jgi:hypothetical protein